MHYTFIPQSVLTEADDFISNNSCVCEGYNLVYECSITGSGLIVWRGTAFECPSSSNEIVLSQGSSGIQEVCNDGAITGRIIRVENNTYVSQLTVSVSAKMIDRNISCFHDGTTQNLIGSSLITLTTGNV